MSDETTPRIVELRSLTTVLTPEAVEAAITRLQSVDTVQRVDELLQLHQHEMKIEMCGVNMFRVTLTHAEGEPVIMIESDSLSNIFKVLSFASEFDDWLTWKADYGKTQDTVFL